jgi:hypothetical protein
MGSNYLSREVTVQNGRRTQFFRAPTRYSFQPSDTFEPPRFKMRDAAIRDDDLESY